MIWIFISGRDESCFTFCSLTRWVRSEHEPRGPFMNVLSAMTPTTLGH